MPRVLDFRWLLCAPLAACSGAAGPSQPAEVADAGSQIAPDSGDERPGRDSLLPPCESGSPEPDHEGGGELLWSYPHELQANAGPTLDRDGNIYLHGQRSLLSDSDAPSFVSLNPDGSLRWSAETNPSESNLGKIPGPIIADDEIWVPTTISLGDNTGQVHRFTPAGDALDPLPLPGRPWNLSAYHDGVLYVPSDRLIAVDRNGLVWDEPFDFRDDGRAGTNVVVSPEGTIYVGARGDDTSLYALDSEGRKIYSQNMGANVNAKLSVDHSGSVYLSMPSKSIDEPAFIQSLDAEGYENWLFDEGPGRWESIHIDQSGNIYAGGIIYANAATNEALYGLYGFKDNGDGTLEVLWFTTIEDVNLADTFVITAGGTLLLTDTCRTLYAINGATGEAEWFFQVPEEGLGPQGLCASPMSAPTLGADGTVYFSAGGGIGTGTLYAVKGDGTGTACGAHWPGNQGGRGMIGSLAE